MDFYELVDQVAILLQQRGKLTYRSLQWQFGLDDEALYDLKEELLYAYPVVDDEGRGLIWTEDAEQELASTISQPEQPPAAPERDPASCTPQHLAEKILTPRSALEGERKQVTVLFADMAGFSTPIGAGVFIQTRSHPGSGVSDTATSKARSLSRTRWQGIGSASPGAPGGGLRLAHPLRTPYIVSWASPTGLSRYYRPCPKDSGVRVPISPALPSTWVISS